MSARDMERAKHRARCDGDGKQPGRFNAGASTAGRVCFSRPKRRTSNPEEPTVVQLETLGGWLLF